MNSVLIIDDDKKLCALMKKCVEQENLSAVVAHGGLEGLRLLEKNKDTCSLIILDVMMPDMNGFQVLQKIREKNNVPVLMLTAKSDEEDKVSGLRLGADDFIPKPFDNLEVLARVEALCRRVGRSASTGAGEQAPVSLVSGSFVLDENRRVLLKAGKPIELTQVEFQIMELFFRNPGVALVRERILKGVWGENYFGDVKIVDVNIRRLRMKVEDEPSHPAHILTVWGYGYRWEE